MKRFWLTFTLSLVFFIQPAFADVALQAKALLQGAYDSTSGLMRDDLRSKGYLPTAQPYNFPPFNYTGSETASATVLAVTGAKAVVDWVLLDVRDNTSRALLARKAVLVQRNGVLLDPQTGSNTLNFTGIDAGTYSVSLHHRNHLAALMDAVALSAATPLLDFTTKGQLPAGDVDANAKIISSGPGNDVTILLGYILTEPQNTLQSANYRLNGYFNTDLNMDGVTVYAGPNNDLNLLQSNVLLHPSNASFSMNFIVDGVKLNHALIPSAPYLEQTQYSFLSQHYTPDATVIGQVTAVDYQQDTLHYAVEGEVPFVVDNQGVIRSQGELQAGQTYHFQIAVSDGAQTSRASIVVKVTDVDAVEQALRTGSVTAVTDTELLDAALATITDNRNMLLDAKVKLFNLNADGTAKADGSSLTALDWNPTHDASTLLSTYGLNTGVLHTNAVYTDGYTVYDKEIGIIGANTARYMVFGGNPLRTGNVTNAQMQQFMKNSVEWLLQRAELETKAFNVVMAHLDESYYFKDESSVRTWLDTHYAGKVSYNAANSCDDAKLAGCVAARPDLLIVSQVANTDSDVAAIAANVQAALQQGIPVLYVHHDGGLTALGEKLLPLFNVTYQWDNYWKKLGLKAFDVTATLGSLPDNIRSIQTVLTHFKAQDYAFDWNMCADGNCDAVVGLQEQFQQGAEAARSMMHDFDVRKVNLFTQHDFRLQKLLALLGDAYRQAVRFPMDKNTTNTTVFLKSLFADHAVYHYRTLNPAQPDMGNFSRSDFSHITPVTKTVKLTSRQHFRAAGVYALPGQTLKVTRKDNSATTTAIFVNSLRVGSTHEFETNGYKRPKRLQSAAFPLQPGETIAFTSPYGGAVQIAFSANDQPVEFTFENVGEHPFWDGSEDNASFSAKLAKGDYDWAEFVTPAFEIHSTLDKMRQSVSNTRWGGGTLEGFAAATMRYTHNFPHVLAGFKGPGIDVVPEIHDFAAAKGFSIDNLDLVKHMNADQATCGYGCSGNPYDAYWAFDPIGHGDIHELGHGLEKSRFRFSGWNYHASTNPYAYYSKTQYFKTTGGEPDCQSLPFKEAFEALQASVGQADSAAYLKANYWDAVADNWSHGVSMTIQMMMLAEDQGKLLDGWHLLARLHILEREFNRAIANDAAWEGKKVSLGFASFTRTEAAALSSNDWMVIALAQVTGLDYRDYLTMWGITFSAKAAAQVAGFSYAAAPRKYFISSPQGYCKGEGFDGNNLPVNGSEVWPLAAQRVRLMGDSFR